MTSQTTAIDPVCGMTVDPTQASAADLSVEYEGQTYYFCGKGCKLEFRDNSAKYLSPDYTPSMEM